MFNGSGVDGAAGQTSSALQQQGFGTAGIGNNPAGNIPTTQIRYRPGSEDKARVVQRFVGGVGQLVEDSGIVEADVVARARARLRGCDPAAGRQCADRGRHHPDDGGIGAPGIRGRHDRGTAARPDPVLLTRRDAERPPHATRGPRRVRA